jgi:hypothetical protein
MVGLQQARQTQHGFADHSQVLAAHRCMQHSAEAGCDSFSLATGMGPGWDALAEAFGGADN